MSKTYFDHIDQSYSFPQEGFNLQGDNLTFHGISIIQLIEKYGSPFKLVYLPSIRNQIKKARKRFESAITKYNYAGNYHYCYCTKCSHFSHVIKSALRENVHLETSSSFDIDIIRKLYNEGQLSKNTMLIHNGHKTDEYLDKIMQLNAEGFLNSIIVLDSKTEIERIKKYGLQCATPIKLGIRIAIEKEPQSAYHTSRLGIRPLEVIDFYKSEIANDERMSLQMIHFYVDSGIKDDTYYWGEFQKALDIYTSVKKVCDCLSSFNLGGGFPIRNNLDFEYDYDDICSKIVQRIKHACRVAMVDDPEIFTEFGRYTVGESSAIIFQVLEQKQQNEKELWYMVNNSLMNTIPDTWSILEKFILLPINKWNNETVQVNIGGISCDHADYYNAGDNDQQLTLPKIKTNDAEPLHIGFFHTGAYQDAISGYGGIKHCLIPPPKLIVIDRDESGNQIDYVYRNEQTVDDMLTILGYEKQ